MTRNPVSRRTALKRISASAGALALFPLLSEEGLAAFADIQRTAAPPSLKALTAEQYATLEALTEAIIPADERSPGAKQARVADYIDLLLSEADETRRQQWTDGLAALDADATARFGRPFVKLDAAQVETVLTDASKNEKAPALRGPAAVDKTPLEVFFVTAKQATVHGYYTSEIGIHQELRYKGNKVLLQFVGCQTVDGKDCPHCGQKAEA
ncbi:MAG TPA: gluconate 2-dehydrogenase subunit 3 family protein [Vicinamibacteria bacterium]|nr:gluconate 2-dehydrogenase subunit 3 family protein [Vicinamibacteria bacterium]